MIANLFDNELKHLPTAQHRDGLTGRQLTMRPLVLEDNGPGFDAEVILHLFERRVKGKQSKGHGLGLAFIDAVVRAHGGTVTARNRESGGTQVVVTLPVAFRHRA